MQYIVEGGRAAFEQLLKEANITRPFLVCGKHSFDLLPCREWLPAGTTRFSGFSANPRVEDILLGAELFRASGCDGIVAVGGGSALDSAKCIKLFGGMEEDKIGLSQPFTDNHVPLMAVPTTAGSGSESTRFAVVYEKGVKQSVTHDSILPGFVLLDAELLETLPVYQKKCTLLDALCQAIESWWSRKCTGESAFFARRAIADILHALDGYLQGDVEAARLMLRGANRAGQAINITTTTAAHAMSYKLTGLYGLPHGHAVAVCLPKVWRALHAMGDGALHARLDDIARALGQENSLKGAAFMEELLEKLEMHTPAISREDLPVLVDSVNPERLSNCPAVFTKETLHALYASLK